MNYILFNFPQYLEVRELRDPGPQVLGGRPQHSEDSEELIDLGVSLEERAPVDHLGVDRADGPDVNGAGVLGTAEQNLGRAVPQRHHLDKFALGQYRSTCPLTS